MDIGLQEINDVVRGVWDTMLQREILLLDTPAITPEGQDCCTGVVQIAGGWEGAVVCVAPRLLLREIVLELSDHHPDDLSIESLKDALAELTNMIGGNLKALLPGPSYLCLPAVVDGPSVLPLLPLMKSELTASFDVNGQPFLVAMLTKK